MTDNRKPYKDRAPKKLTFFHEGELVCLTKDLPHKPTMMVTAVPKTHIPGMKEGEKPVLIGIKCLWFTTTGLAQEKLFNSKDLTKC